MLMYIRYLLPFVHLNSFWETKFYKSVHMLSSFPEYYLGCELNPHVYLGLFLAFYFVSLIVLFCHCLPIPLSLCHPKPIHCVWGVTVLVSNHL